jgi:8-oxo-dGTP pyrophosphatase MutT (NUDIX family)
MNTEKVRPLALGIFRRNDRILVFESRKELTGEIFYRPLGGAIEFGEYGHQALVREMREELGAEIENLRYLGLRENLFRVPDGRRGHEIVLLFEADLTDETLYGQDEMVAHEDDGSTFKVVWKPLDFFRRGEAPLYPSGLLEMLDAATARTPA